MRPRWLVIAVLACGLLTACASAHPRATSSVTSIGPVRCPLPTAQTATRSALRAFVPVAAVWCQESDRRYPGDGQWSVMVKRQTTLGVTALRTAFLQPDDPASTGFCAAVLVIGPAVALADAGGRYVVPAYPHDGCGQPKRTVISAVESGAWQVVSTTRERLLVSESALAARCEMQWKNEISYMAGAGESAPATPVFGTAASVNVQVCLYRTSASDRTVGTFTGTRHLDPDATTRLRRALSGAGQPGQCPLQQSFAVVRLPGGAWVNVELGGCWRVVRDDLGGGRIGRADPVVTARLLA